MHDVNVLHDELLVLLAVGSVVLFIVGIPLAFSCWYDWLDRKRACTTTTTEVK